MKREMTKRIRRTILSLAVVVAVGGISAAEAQVRFGGQFNAAEDTDLGLGPRLAWDVTQLGAPLQVITTFDVFFPDGDVDYWELNGNLVYKFALEDTPKLVPYAGGGLNIAHVDRDGGPGVSAGSDTDVGVNFLGGAEFPLGGFAPFVELRVEAGGGEQLVFSAGILVP